MDIRNLHHIDKKGVVANGYATIDGCYVNDVAVLRSKEGKIFYDLPHRSYKDENGEWKNAYYAQPVDKEGSEAVLAQVTKAVEEGTYRKVTSERNPALLGFMSVKGKFSVKVSYTDKGHVFTEFRTYEKDGEKKYAHYVGLSKEQSDAVAAAFKAALA